MTREETQVRAPNGARRIRAKRAVAAVAATFLTAAGLVLGTAPADAWHPQAYTSPPERGYAGFHNNWGGSESVYVCDTKADGYRAVGYFSFPGSTGVPLHAASGAGTCASRTPAIPEGSAVWARVCSRNGQYGADFGCGNWTFLGYA